MLGLLGALDPYKHKQQQRNMKPSKMGTPHSKPMDKATPGQNTGEERGMGGGEGMREGGRDYGCTSLLFFRCG